MGGGSPQETNEMGGPDWASSCPRWKMLLIIQQTQQGALRTLYLGGSQTSCASELPGGLAK